MQLEPLVPCWNRNQRGQQARHVAYDYTETEFLRKHCTLDRIELRETYPNFNGLLASSAVTNQPKEINEQDLFEYLSDPKHTFLTTIVEGSSGSGKSELLRAIQIKWQNAIKTGKRPNDQLLVVEKASTTAKGFKNLAVAVFRELGIDVDKDPTIQSMDREIRITANTFANTLGNIIARQQTLQIVTGDGTPDVDSVTKQKITEYLQSQFLHDGKSGGFQRIVDVLSGGEQENEEIAESPGLEFTVDDLRDQLSSIHLRRLRNKVSPAALTLVEELHYSLNTYQETDPLESHVSRFLTIINQYLNAAIRACLNFEDQKVTERLIELRTYLKKKNKRLVFIFEDMTFSNDFLRQLDIPLHRQDDLSDLIFIGATTDENLKTIPTTLRSRIQHLFHIPNHALLAREEKRLEFAARYLNAGRLGDIRDSTNACENCEVRDRCHATFGKVTVGEEDIGLFPLNSKVVNNVAQMDPDRPNAFEPIIPRKFAQRMDHFWASTSENSYLEFLKPLSTVRLNNLPLSTTLQRNLENQFSDNKSLREDWEALISFWGEPNSTTFDVNQIGGITPRLALSIGHQWPFDNYAVDHPAPKAGTTTQPDPTPQVNPSVKPDPTPQVSASADTSEERRWENERRKARSVLREDKNWIDPGGDMDTYQDAINGWLSKYDVTKLLNENLNFYSGSQRYGYAHADTKNRLRAIKFEFNTPRKDENFLLHTEHRENLADHYTSLHTLENSLHKFSELDVINIQQYYLETWPKEVTAYSERELSSAGNETPDGWAPWHLFIQLLCVLNWVDRVATPTDTPLSQLQKIIARIFENERNIRDIPRRIDDWWAPKSTNFDRSINEQSLEEQWGKLYGQGTFPSFEALKIIETFKTDRQFSTSTFDYQVPSIRRLLGNEGAPNILNGYRGKLAEFIELSSQAIEKIENLVGKRYKLADLLKQLERIYEDINKLDQDKRDFLRVHDIRVSDLETKLQGAIDNSPNLQTCDKTLTDFKKENPNLITSDLEYDTLYGLVMQLHDAKFCPDAFGVDLDAIEKLTNDVKKFAEDITKVKSLSTATEPSGEQVDAAIKQLGESTKEW